MVRQNILNTVRWILVEKLARSAKFYVKFRNSKNNPMDMQAHYVLT